MPYFAPVPTRRASTTAKLWDSLLTSLGPRRAFCVCGAIGVVIGLPLSLLAAAHLGLSLGLMTAVAIAGIATLLATGMVTKVLTGQESFVYFRYIPTIFAVAAGIVFWTRQPVLPYMDSLVLGTAAFLACGRIGCLLVGCCHGRPSRWGIRYRQTHAECGFPPHYVEVRLFPIQAVESLFVFSLVVIGTAILWSGASSGTGLSFYIAAYAAGRFFLEFARGDAERPFLWHFSEAQWTSILLLWVVVLAEHWRILPLARWHLIAAIGLVVCMGVAAAWRRLDTNHLFQLRHPQHVRELARALRRISQPSCRLERTPLAAPLLTTSCGIHISGSRIHNDSCEVQHYCFSRDGAALSSAEAQGLARTAALLDGQQAAFQLVPGQPGIFHALFYLQPQSQGVPARNARTRTSLSSNRFRSSDKGS